MSLVFIFKMPLFVHLFTLILEQALFVFSFLDFLLEFTISFLVNLTNKRALELIIFESIKDHALSESVACLTFYESL